MQHQKISVEKTGREQEQTLMSRVKLDGNPTNNNDTYSFQLPIYVPVFKIVYGKFWISSYKAGNIIVLFHTWKHSGKER